MYRSIVEYYPEHGGYKCGYCKSPNTNFSHGMWAHSLTVGDYQDLIDRGWRRSGQYCYKPTMDVTCCPMYTIRCRVSDFKATKSQKKVLKRFSKYLSGQDISETSGERKMSTCSGGDTEDLGEGREHFVESHKEHRDIDISNIKMRTQSGDVPKDGVFPKAQAKTVTKQHERKEATGPDPTKGPCKKAKQMRRERKLEKLKDRGIDVTTLSNKNKEKQIEDFINELPEDVRQKLEIRLVRTTPPSPEWEASANESHKVYVKYQTVIHNEKPEKSTKPKFYSFLVQSPLLEEYSDSGPSCGYGSFHQQYWLDKKLIAVGVIDILPKCVSSVYFFYDPDYMNLTLGTYGALREIEFTRKLHSVAPELKYYYMGYYIHSCRKMRYKGNFYPSDLLCPETYEWFPLKDCLPKLEVSPYCRLNPDIDRIDTNYPTDSDLNYIPILVDGDAMLFEQLRSNNKSVDKNKVTEYAGFVGAKTAKRVILAI
ncbi:arginyl-tRNA--protein transferase 1 [Amyelois transitella]|uniref:arginyl-tRNA--protein transferase 1 n=1 Tax=Amyelois transitella TaxID=680683 RepID=UPI00299030F9|nr:arginyl-tRNA--protein transferase 1 [Amyelois transitella]